jgi:soluble lytic murein transglycosylase-like protein
MDNFKVDSSLSEQGIDKNKQKTLHRKSHRFSTKLISFLTLCLILLSSVITVNLATVNSAEAKSESAEQQVKKKKYIKSSRKSRRYKKSRKSKRRYKKRYKKSRRYRNGKRYYKARYKKSKRYRKNKKRYKKSRRYRNGKRFYKTSYKTSNRYRKGKKRYKKSRKKRPYTGKRSRYRTCDQLKSSILHKKSRRYQDTISHAAKQHGVSQHFIKAVITVETCFRSGLRGTSGEKGLMQLMPATAKRFGVKNRFSTWENIHGGTRYLRYLLNRFDGNKAYAAAAYNGGSGAVSKKTGPKFYAVRNYSRMVMNAYRKFKPRRIQAKARKRKSSKKTKS